MIFCKGFISLCRKTLTVGEKPTSFLKSEPKITQKLAIKTKKNFETFKIRSTYNQSGNLQFRSSADLCCIINVPAIIHQ